MNKVQKEILNSRFKSEQEALRTIEAVYKKALSDVLVKMKDFTARVQLDAGDTSAIYQLKYQQQLYKQLTEVLDGFIEKQYKTVNDFIEKAYDEGFVGTMYDLHNQGIPFIFPPNHKAVVDAVFLESKISAPLYQALGENVELLKKRIANNVARGIANASSWQNIAMNIKNSTILPMSRVMTIARTEGHRVVNKATSNAQHLAKENGADIVKQWDAAMDKRTRKGHAEVDGEIRELDEKFSNGLMYPGDPNGSASQVINCRCALLQRAKWAMDAEELETLKKRAEYFGLDKAKNFKDFKNKYMKAVEKVKKEEPKSTAKPKKTEKKPVAKAKPKKETKAYKKLIEIMEKNEVEYIKPRKLRKKLSETEIIERLGGGDKTGGSCSSLAFAYIANKGGCDVLDFRGGISQRCFADRGYLSFLDGLDGVKVINKKVKKEAYDGFKILQSDEVKPNIEYRLSIGRHAAIFRKNDDGTMEYLELQSAKENGWKELESAQTLIDRFGAKKTPRRFHGKVFEQDVSLIEVDSLKDNEEFLKLTGYFNTAADKQKKGVSGHER